MLVSSILYDHPYWRFHAEALAVARVKKIISMDEDIAACSNNAAFAISVATVNQHLQRYFRFIKILSRSSLSAI